MVVFFSFRKTKYSSYHSLFSTKKKNNNNGPIGVVTRQKYLYHYKGKFAQTFIHDGTCKK